MNPKEKAKELFDKIHKAALLQEWETKACAIITIDEIINELGELRKPEYTIFITSYEKAETMDGYEKTEFWQEVKKEIESI